MNKKLNFHTIDVHLFEENYLLAKTMSPSKLVKNGLKRYTKHRRINMFEAFHSLFPLLNFFHLPFFQILIMRCGDRKIFFH